MSHAKTNRVEPRERLEEPGKYAGYCVLDPEGRRIGSVQEVFVNGDGEPEYVRIRMGPFWLKTALIPVQLVAVYPERHTLVLQ